MKKILSISLAFVLISATAFAQRGPNDNDRRTNDRPVMRGGQFSKAEKYKMSKQSARYEAAKRHALRDGIITAAERRQLQKIKKHNRRDAVLYKNNRQHNRF